MILTGLLLLVLLYFLLRHYLPTIVYITDGYKVQRVVGKVGVYALRASEKVPVPSYNWREVPTGVSIAPFGSIIIRGKIYNLFGQVGCRVYPIPELKMKGVDVLPTIYNNVPREPIKVILTNMNPKYPFIAKEGAVIAYLELIRVPSFKLVTFTKEEINAER